MIRLFILVAFVGLSVSSTAQEMGAAEKHSVATNSFWSNWFVQGGIGWNTFYVGGQQHVLSSPFRKFPLGTAAGDGGHRTALGFSVALGKWFTPGIGLRTKAAGLWYGKAFSSESGKYMTLNEQVLLNLSNMLYGYKSTRLWNVIPFLGAGLARNIDANHNSLAWSVGVLNTFRLNKTAALNLELGYVSYGKDFLATGPVNGLKAHQRDHQFSVEVGVTLYIGKKGWKSTPDLESLDALTQSELEALNAQLADAEAENDRLRRALEAKPVVSQQPSQPTPETSTKYVFTPISVFFRLGSAEITSRKDLQNVADMVKVANAQQSTFVVTGYADHHTGRSEYNMQLSQQRAEAVAAELVKMGVGRERIETVARGGVDTLKPDSHNRRATIEVKQ